MKEKEREKQFEEAKAVKDRLFAEYEITENPKAELLWSKAWDLGHSAGYHEVEHYFRELVELITP